MQVSESEIRGDGFAPLNEFLCFTIYSTGHALTQFYRPILEAIGLTYPQYLLMVALWAKDDQIIKDLGSKLFLESSTLTPLVKRLESAGFITRCRDPKDERQVRVKLTDKGRALKSEALKVPGCIQSAVGMNIEKVMEIQAAVAGIRDRLIEGR
ncbi:MarR family transcriptional regulator [Pseudomonas sp. 31-12]|uniref:MarR family winged helix-turn-helix transcriptional regulator n=1 Tax=Pseudomonas sp. 31-12 TaxID=2201356 RepID=UPI000D6B082D|nr:MarR family transcriptional regulator [Pseudomonas sp. 31-12]AWM92492.1 MarR family transcriptional regulator [Pseudomonas sp. 31-12]